MMWEMVYADGHVSEFERNLIWRAADLLGVSSRERIELGQQVASRRRPASAATKFAHSRGKFKSNFGQKAVIAHRVLRGFANFGS